MIEELKNVKVSELTQDQVVEHKKNVLELKDEALIVEYLKYAIDTFYKTEEEGENEENVATFFATEEFKPFYSVILTLEDEE